MLGTVHRAADLHDDPLAVRTARRLVTETLIDWGLPHLADDAVLVSSELITNATVHGDPPVGIAIRRGRTGIVIEVTDASHELPIMQIPGEGGHFGMWLAEGLAELSIQLGPQGKTISARLPRAP